MIACVAAGGSGSRMSPASQFCNKHLILVGKNNLMIDMPMKFLRSHGIKDVSVVTGSNHASQIVDYIADGEKYGFKSVDYFFQPKPSGIADVLNRIKKTQNEGVLLILGDNYFSSVQLPLLGFKDSDNAIAFQYDVGSISAARRFGQVIYDDSLNVLDIVEKPDNPQHSYILTGLYYFPKDVFSLVSMLSPSKRGELEISDLLRVYAKNNALEVKTVIGKWFDLGEQETWADFVYRYAIGELPEPGRHYPDRNLNFGF